MHRTTTTATLLVTAAVTALSGCVTVQRPPVPGPPTAAPSRESVPRPDGSADPRVVQAPAREALEMIEPSGRAQPDTPEPHRSAATAPSPGRPGRPDRPHGPHGPHGPHKQSPAHPPHPHPHAKIPEVSQSLPKGSVPKNADVCALGRQYGGWRADSPEAVICQQTYGR
ncbi:hypothetical protein ACFY1L_20065 [Streptomyces sp. NPDC001663]|uniref:hypothetical protein n=1 Tax=Streptomyces sp. NPDC001663 TaxID=3364597 RepID=UPI0036D08FC8